MNLFDPSDLEALQCHPAMHQCWWPQELIGTLFFGVHPKHHQNWELGGWVAQLKNFQVMLDHKLHYRCDVTKSRWNIIYIVLSCRTVDEVVLFSSIWYEYHVITKTSQELDVTQLMTGRQSRLWRETFHCTHIKVICHPDGISQILNPWSSRFKVISDCISRFRDVFYHFAETIVSFITEEPPKPSTKLRSPEHCIFRMQGILQVECL